MTWIVITEGECSYVADAASTLHNECQNCFKLHRFESAAYRCMARYFEQQAAVFRAAARRARASASELEEPTTRMEKQP